VRRFLFFVLLALLGFGISAVAVCQIAFVAAVIPHAGLY